MRNRASTLLVSFVLAACSSGSSVSGDARSDGRSPDQSSRFDLGAGDLRPSDGPRGDSPSDGPRGDSRVEPDSSQSGDRLSIPVNVNPPSSTVSLVFVHHSVGEMLSASYGGNLRESLNQNNYFVRDTNYGWGPADLEEGDGTIGDHTDIGHWSRWFLGTYRDSYVSELLSTDHLTSELGDNTISDPGGTHTVALFKSCFLSGQKIQGNPGDAPAAPGTSNPIYGKNHSEEADYTVSNIKGLYRDLLGYFATRQDVLFVLLTTPPSRTEDTDQSSAANLRDINTWLVHHWLEQYPASNVAVFDFYTVLTSNGGDSDTNDLGASDGSHHRFRAGAVEHLVGSSDLLAYPSEDSHPKAAGLEKATAEFVPLLNAAYHCWKGDGGCPSLLGRP